MTGGGGTAEPLGDIHSVASALVVDRPIVLVGLMGAGKTTVGRRLAALLRLPFVDADEEIEKAAGLKIAEIFAMHGEEEFRRGERRVIARLLHGPPQVLATGGGAFMNDETRALVLAHATSVWLRADLDVLMRRVEKRDNRPLLKQGDPRATMERLMAERYPIYGEADLVVDSNNGPHASAVTAVIRALAARAAVAGAAP
ncbi:MAG: shikimate kinase [Alphaproteobacteria bacterium]|nr:shikimate kinase [Alphaproteobacteria bacterium]MDZ4777409.1 shikimate kinase [Alphaproteobacteria bacterium]